MENGASHLKIVTIHLKVIFSHSGICKMLKDSELFFCGSQ